MFFFGYFGLFGIVVKDSPSGQRGGSEETSVGRYSCWFQKTNREIGQNLLISLQIGTSRISIGLKKPIRFSKYEIINKNDFLKKWAQES
jgi:hypothetical protein